MRNPTVSIIIPNWNGKRLLEKNLPSVFNAKKLPSNKIVEIIIVDDASTDNSIDFLEREYGKKIRLIRHSKNRGFSKTVNLGVRHAKGKLICLLNTDVIPKRNFLTSTFPLFKQPKVFAVGLHEEGYGPAVGFFEGGYPQHMGGEESDDVSETFWINGGSGVFVKKYWDELKGLDSELYDPFYWEDVDLGYRAHKRGYKLLWQPEANVVHKHESVINPKNFNEKYLVRIKERNHLLFTWKNINSRNLLNRHFKVLFKRTVKNPGYSRVVFLAILRLQKVLRLRKREEKESSVSDEVVFAKFS